jgi:copper(I)-binding protein
MKRLVLATLVLAALSAPALATVTVTEPSVRATTSFQKSTVAFMQITSSYDARLVKAESPVAKVVEIHEMVMKNNVMKMSAISGIDLPAGKAVNLKADGYMVMLMGLKQQIKEGDNIPISIVIEGKDKRRETIKLNATAMTMNAAAAGKHAHAHTQDHEQADEHASEHAQEHAPEDAHEHQHTN